MSSHHGSHPRESNRLGHGEGSLLRHLVLEEEVGPSQRSLTFVEKTAEDRRPNGEWDVAEGPERLYGERHPEDVRLHDLDSWVRPEGSTELPG